MKPKILTTLQTYTRQQFVLDIIAGLTVAMVALPLSIAIAIASGADPSKGIVTAVVGGFLISLFGGSKVQIGGPTGAFIVVVFGIIADHGYDGLVIATLMAGVILVLAGLLRTGNLIRYVPEAVVNGFTIGIAIIIAASQFRDVLGLQMTQIPADFIEKMQALWAARDSLNMTSLAIALLAMMLIILFRRSAPRLPGLFIAMVIVSALAAVMKLPIDTIGSRFGELPHGLPIPSAPTISVARAIELLPSALVIAFLAGVESLLSAMVADKMIGSYHRPNAEVLAQGFANIGSALFGGLPATGAIARTATNVRAGGKTPVAGIVHALAILGVTMMIGRLVGFLAMPALAALLMVTAYNMSEPHKWREFLGAPNEDRLLLLLTLILTIFADLTVAISVGTAVGLAIRLRKQDAATDDWSVPDR
ncbi:MAG: SulP family inorganic anion transporter [Pseudomonadota bacterium]